MEEIEVAVKSLSPFVWVRTHEEQRFILDFSAKMKESGRDVFIWSIYQGIVSQTNVMTGERATGAMQDTLQVDKALNKIINMQPAENQRGVVVIMRDPMMILQGPVVRQLRDCYVRLKKFRVTILFLSAQLGHGPGGKNSGLPPTMDKQIVVCDYDLPNINQINKMIRELIRQTARINNPSPKISKTEQERLEKQLEKLKFSKEEYHEFSRALQGLTHTEVDVAVSSCLHHMKTLDINFLLNAKKQIISKSDILEYLDHTKTISDIGGMDLAKDFFEDYTENNTAEAKAFGAEPLKAVLLVGIPGCGKSQMCKAVASMWKNPLLRMDVGKVMTGLVGGSESRMREAIKQVEAVAPCVLWIDEVEKALSGTKSSNFSDGGTMARVFGTLLTAMEEGLKDVTILATANDLSAMPPEFLRRFDEIFFVDLPGPAEREEIFKIHLRLKGFEDSELDMESLVKKSENYTGHEIEKAIKRGITKAFRTDDKKLTTELIEMALDDTKPIYDTAHEKLIKMREKAQNRFRYASSWARDQGKEYAAKQKKMDVKDIDLPDMTTNKLSAPAKTDLDGDLELN